MIEISCNILVIGGGPGGYVCAIRAGQLGLDAVIVDAAQWGGTCLKVGCIPSKALIHAADEFYRINKMATLKTPLGISVATPELDFAKTVFWKDGIVARLSSGVAGLLKKSGVKTLFGEARFHDGRTVEIQTETGSQLIRAENIVIATGSTPVSLSNLPFGGPIVSSTEALSLDHVPGRLTIIGGGYIGVELGMAYAKMGSSVTIVEASEKILPAYDHDLTAFVEKRLAELGVTVLTATLAQGLSANGSRLLLEDVRGNQQALEIEKVLVTIGRKPVTEGWGIEELVLDMAGPFIQIDDQCRTSMRGIYAIGDVTGEPMLAHRAMAQGEMVAEILAGYHRSWDKRCIPAICFTDPEIVSVGLAPQEAAEKYEVIMGTFPFRANGRAMTLMSDEGFVRVVARADNHLILGIQAVGANVAELSAGFALAIEMGACLEDVAGTIHAHPTGSEVLQEAARAALGHAIHI